MGERRTTEYRTWTHIKQRCHKESNNRYYNYGAKGIVVCERWRDSYKNFLEDMGRKPTPKHTIDRIDNMGNYEPSNCRWATKKEQAQNTSLNRNVELNGETHCVSEWARRKGMSVRTLCYRLDAGWTVQEALEYPPKRIPLATLRAMAKA